jgi:triosephosphate isomerase
LRTPFIAGNWKMNKTVGEAIELVTRLLDLVADVVDVEIAVCPPFTALTEVKKAIERTNIKLGAQNMYWEEKGAYTGETSPVMLKDIGCDYVIIGHSERRAYFGETDEGVNKKVKVAFAHGITPIVCVGETLEEREAGRTEEVVRREVEVGLKLLPSDKVDTLVIAYEPIWAIGTGRSSKGADANQVVSFIRQVLTKMYSEEIAQRIRVQYGGSVKPSNIVEFMSEEEIDGALVGGASLKAEDFSKIVRYKK